MRFSKVVFISTVTLASTGIAAYENSAELDAYCNYLKENASRQSWTQLSPDLVSSFTSGGNMSGQLDDPSYTQGFRRMRLGVEYDVLNIARNSFVKDLATASCGARRAQAAIAVAGELDAAEKELRVLAAQKSGAKLRLQNMKKGLQTLEVAMSGFRRRVKAGKATIFELGTANESVAAARLQGLDAQSELNRVSILEASARTKVSDLRGVSRDLLPGNTGILSVQKTLNDSLGNEVSLRSRREFWNNFALRLSGGYEKLSARNSTAPTSTTPYFALELKMNFGATVKAFDGDEKKFIDEWTAARKIAVIEEIKNNPVLENRVAHLNTQKEVYEKRLQEIQEFAASADFSASTLQSSASTLKLYAIRLAAQADLDAVESELAILRQRVPANVAARSLVNDTKVEAAAPAAAPGSWRRSDRKNFRYTQPAAHPERARMKFVIKERMASPMKLGSGAVRHQLGLMLRQENQCNLLYVMIRLDAEPSIVVQEKYNDGEASHAECLNNGYRTIKGTAVGKVGAVVAGEIHELGAEVEGGETKVYFDGRLVWRGGGPGMIKAGSNIGVRSDNLSFEFELSDEAPRKGKGK